MFVYKEAPHGAFENLPFVLQVSLVLLFISAPQGFSQPKVTWSAPFCILSRPTSASTKTLLSSCSSWVVLVRALAETGLILFKNSMKKHNFSLSTAELLKTFWKIIQQQFQSLPSFCSSEWHHLQFRGPLQIRCKCTTMQRPNYFWPVYI